MCVLSQTFSEKVRGSAKTQHKPRKKTQNLFDGNIVKHLLNKNIIRANQILCVFYGNLGQKVRAS